MTPHRGLIVNNVMKWPKPHTKLFMKRRAQCQRKDSYQNVMKAQKRAMVVFREYGSVQVPYLCPICKRYHLTSK